MGLWSNFKEQYKIERAKQRPDPLDLTHKDLRGDFPRWPMYERRDVRNRLRNADPIRFARLESDMAWLRRQCIKKGLDPEVAKWLV